MTGPRPIKVGEELPAMDCGEQPARRERGTKAGSEPKRKAGKGGGKAGRRWKLLNAVVDKALPLFKGRAALAAWVVLFRHAKADGIVKASVADLARRAGCGESAMGRALRDLRAVGLVERIKRGTLAGGPSVYRLLMPEGDRP